MDVLPLLVVIFVAVAAIWLIDFGLRRVFPFINYAGRVCTTSTGRVLEKAHTPGRTGSCLIRYDPDTGQSWDEHEWIPDAYELKLEVDGRQTTYRTNATFYSEVAPGNSVRITYRIGRLIGGILIEDISILQPRE
jgi:hypothetical protein